MIDRHALVSDLLTRGVEEVIDQEKLRVLLGGRKKLRVKHGIDPTGKGIHIGRAVVLWKLKTFQDLGHKVVLVIGDMTAQIGDPSDKLEKRPFLGRKEINENLKGYLQQIGRVVDVKKAEVRYNSEWLGKLRFQEISELAEIFSVQQMLARRNFSDRMKKQEEISIRELLYPLMQGYDSVAVKADVEIGGSDQLFNLLAGRKIQERYGQKPQQVMTTEMLLGVDGRKMSTSWGNVVKIGDTPDEQFGKIMSLHDDMIPHYLLLATGLPRREIREYENDLKKGVNPKGIKMKLAYEIVKRYHGETAAKKSQAEFEDLFSGSPEAANVPVLQLPLGKTDAIELILKTKVTQSKSEARRLVEQGGLKINGQKVGLSCTLRSGDLLKVGKRHFFRVK